MTAVRRAVLVAAVLLTPCLPAQAQEGRSFVYVASAGAGTGLEGLWAGNETPLGRPAVMGTFGVLPRGRTLTLTLDDVGAATGAMLPVALFQRDRPHVSRCVPNRMPVRFNVAAARWATVEIRSPAAGWAFTECSGGATAGTARVSF